MKFTSTLAVLGLVSGASAQKMSLRRVEPAANAAPPKASDYQPGSIQHLDLEIEVEGGQRKLFPLLPGTPCPTGHTCRVRNGVAGTTSMMAAMKDNMKDDIALQMDWEAFNQNLEVVVASDDYCSRRAAMTRAAGLAAGVAAATVAQPSYAAETKKVKVCSLYAT